MARSDLQNGLVRVGDDRIGEVLGDAIPGALSPWDAGTPWPPDP